MPVYYLETSALLKKYRPERGTDVVTELFDKKGQLEVFITSYLTVVEIASVTTRLLRARTITRRAHNRILGNLSHDTNEAILLQPISDGVVLEAVILSQRHAIRAPDAIHLSTAMRARATAPSDSFYFLGSDARLNSACRSSGLLVLDPEEANSLEALRNLRGHR